MKLGSFQIKKPFCLSFGIKNLLKTQIEARNARKEKLLMKFSEDVVILLQAKKDFFQCSFLGSKSTCSSV